MHTHKRCTSLHIIHYECHEVIYFIYNLLHSSLLFCPYISSLVSDHLLLFLLSHFLSPDSPLLLTLFSYFSYLISSFDSFDSSHSSLIPPSPFLPLTLLTLLFYGPSFHSLVILAKNHQIT